MDFASLGEPIRSAVALGRPIGQNQAIQHPLAEIELEAAELMMLRAAAYDRGEEAGGLRQCRQILRRGGRLSRLRDGGHDAWRHGATPANTMSSAISARSRSPASP